jgi:hypothetical protein
MKHLSKKIIFFFLILSFWLISAPAKAQTFQDRVAENAVQQWKDFHNPPIVVKSKADTEVRSDRTPEKPLEYDKCETINTYWRAVATPPKGDFCKLPRIADEKRGGWDNYPWSAAFVSYIMKESGAKNQFKYSTSHSTYIIDAVKNRDNANASFRGYPIDWIKPTVGDLICAPRSVDKNLRYSQIVAQKSFKSHCDIVVAKNGNQLEVIGGNVGDSVAKTIVSLDSDGHIKVTDKDFRPWFVIIKNYLK